MIVKDGVEIRDLADWKKRAGPKRCGQWVADRSAMCCAEAWLGARPDMPADIKGVLEAHADFGPVGAWQAEPEKQQRFDAYGGEPRNCDLAVEVQDHHGRYLLAIEAKADEPLGDPLSEVVREALDARLENARSRRVDRVLGLIARLFEPAKPGQPRLWDLRYQLLTACSGALSEAQGLACERCVVLVHEFDTRLTAAEKHKTNADDLDQFAARLSRGLVTKVPAGGLCGPFNLPGWPGVKLYLGKVRTKVP